MAKTETYSEPENVQHLAALISGRWLGWAWLDPITGMVGGLIILLWGLGLCRSAAFELLNVDTSSCLSEEIRSVLEEIDDVSVRDLHVWSLGPGARACVVSLVSTSPRDVDEYRKQVLGSFELSHLTIEVRRSVDEHGVGPCRALEGRGP